MGIEAIVDSLRSRVGGKSVDVYAVNYQSSSDFATSADGVIDASNKVQNIAATYPVSYRLRQAEMRCAAGRSIESALRHRRVT
jgi:hypothetical protein